MAKKFGNALDRYRSPRRIGLLTPESEWPAIFSNWFDEDEKNLRLLCDHFGIESFDYRELCLRLAAECVPAFRLKPARGRPSKWNDYLGGLLVAELEAKDKGKGIAWAAKQLANDESWKSRFGSEERGFGLAEVFRTKYFEYRDTPAAKIMRSARKNDNNERIGGKANPNYSPDAWRSLVADALASKAITGE